MEITTYIRYANTNDIGYVNTSIRMLKYNIGISKFIVAYGNNNIGYICEYQYWDGKFQYWYIAMHIGYANTNIGMNNVLSW